MTLAIAALLVILVVTIVLLSLDWLPPDVVALGLLIVLAVAGLLPADQAFAGFGSDTVIVLLGLLILTAALLRTGIVDLVSQRLLERVGNRPKLLLPAVMLVSAILGSFISNTATTAFLLPIVVSLARRMRVHASLLLMPLAFASILTSSVTLVSSSTNIIVSGLITQHGLAPISMFELAPVGIPIGVAGLIYMLTIGRRFVPDHSSVESLAEEYGTRPYLAEIKLPGDSPVVGKTLGDAGLGSKFDLTVLSIVRSDKRQLAPRSDTVLEADDTLMVEGRREDILQAKEAVGIDLATEAEISAPDLDGANAQLVEVILLPRSSLIWNTLQKLRLRERYGLQVLAIQRHEGTIRRRISQVQMHLGDVLLVHGPEPSIALLQENGAFRVLDVLQGEPPKRWHPRLAVAIFVGALIASSFNLLTLPVAMLGGALLVFVTGCITPEEAYREVDWRLVILIGCMLSLGVAMQYTGTAEFIATHLVGWLGTTSPLWLLTAFFVLTMILTQPMSNQAAAAVVLPIALQIAAQLHLNPRTFAVMIAVAASCSFITPLEPSCLLVYGTGHYRFRDFFKVGIPLTLVIYLVAIALVPLFWPL